MAAPIAAVVSVALIFMFPDVNGNGHLDRLPDDDLLEDGHLHRDSNRLRNMDDLVDGHRDVLVDLERRNERY